MLWREDSATLLAEPTTRRYRPDTMRRAIPLSAALFLAFAAYSFQAVQLPGRVLACSCAGPPPSLAEAAQQDQVTIVAGTVGIALPDRTPIAVDSWFHGAFPTDVIWVMGGTNSMSSCDVFMNASERRLLVLYGGPSAPDANGLYSTSLCAPSGVAGTLEGDALLAEAADTFGNPQAPPPSPEPQPAAPVDLSPWFGEGLVWAAALFGIGLLLFGAVILVARRRPPG